MSELDELKQIADDFNNLVDWYNLSTMPNLSKDKLGEGAKKLEEIANRLQEYRKEIKY